MYTLDDLKAECARGNIKARVHPHDPEVVLYNYTQKAQYDGSWTPAICASRGLILRGTQHIARPFKKFFNVSEHVGHGDMIPEHTRWELYDKVDGSLGVVYRLGDKWEIATRGSFTSPQSVVAAGMLADLETSVLDPAWTYMFEIVYPENRIVVDYGERKELVLLGATRTESGAEMEYDQLVSVAGLLGTSVVIRIACGIECHKSWSDLQKFIADRYEGTTRTGSEAEGFVVRLCGSDGTVTRAKWKYSLYSQLHKTLTYLTNITVWEHLAAGTLDSLLELMPDETFSAIKTMESELVAAHTAANKKATTLYAGISGTTPATRAAQINMCGEFKSILFAMQQGKTDRVERLLWEMCRPEKSVSLGLMADD